MAGYTEEIEVRDGKKLTLDFKMRFLRVNR
jgi:hypothetical protein